ncbi:MULTISPECIES: SigB/SigF/SigG family RNA polymerase sigma factor [Streptomyces]|uniref:SigB/SigF/SigG family RNA polymerase sigma factor n=1 Tax=Streptomyces achmelvichensis TaxID=3134111 RepID=A0ACC6PZ00_9ACTN|nr:SigB/SigF/SigG family RNA polymerase sigma factor [Streptomyces sp. NBC_01167]
MSTFLETKGACDLPPTTGRRRTAHAVDGLPLIERASKVAPKDARSLSPLFLRRLRALEEGSREYQYARNTLVEMNRSLVHFTAGRFRSRGNGEMEDIVQVGTVGLIKAIDRFDLSREVEFTSFAIPYIVGEIKRYFRDSTWAVHVPRRLQELRIDLARAREQLARVSGHEPTVGDLAAYLELSDEEIVEGLIAASGYTAGPLDASDEHIGDGHGERPALAHTIADKLGSCDPAIELVEDLHALAPLLGRLSDRERRILELRFGQEKTQQQIGTELGISQMHVSRLLARILKRLRVGMLTDH